MAKIEYKLECALCKTKFEPDNIYRLSSTDEKYRQQVFMDGICPQDGKDVLGWIGIRKGTPANYYPISLKHAKRWYARLDTDLIQETPVKIDPAKHDKKRMKTVLGFKKERNSGQWMPQIQAVR